MRYIMSLDGGGTKLNCLIADEEGNLVGIGKGGVTNPNYASLDAVEESIRSAVSGALAWGGIDKNGICIVNASIIMGGQWPEDVIKKLLHEKAEINLLPEFTPSLYGAIQEDYGALVLSGTGSFASIRTEKGDVNVGGWGDVLGDEGSGYYMGHEALKACAHMEDGVMPYTLLSERIREVYKIDTMRKIVADLSNAALGKQRTMIAAVCPIVGWCADRGDAVAEGIIRRAAGHLAEQLVAVVRKHDAYQIPITVSGGAWKTSPLFFSYFSAMVKQEIPSAVVRPPLFEPVVGGILLGLRDRGFPVKGNMEQLKKAFASFMYPEELFV